MDTCEQVVSYVDCLKMVAKSEECPRSMEKIKGRVIEQTYFEIYKPGITSFGGEGSALTDVSCADNVSVSGSAC